MVASLGVTGLTPRRCVLTTVHRAALFQLDRGLSRRIEELREGLLRLQAMLTYEIAFPEEDDGALPERRIQGAARWLMERLEALLVRESEGELVRDGALTVIAHRGPGECRQVQRVQLSTG